jgi:hypothetical protein
MHSLRGQRGIQEAAEILEDRENCHRRPFMYDKTTKYFAQKKRRDQWQIKLVCVCNRFPYMICIYSHREVNQTI